MAACIPCASVSSSKSYSSTFCNNQVMLLTNYQEVKKVLKEEN